jgi:transcriptional regulator with XRE-family HTH domain
MRFAEWMNKTNASDASFAARARVSRETVRRYRCGEREPDTKTMALIFELTGGEVAPNDWAGVGPRTEVATEGGVQS